MLQKPPPIQWLPVFETAARLLNFKKAADELCVSPPAISQQIKVLEEYLGVQLFDRSTKKMRLTRAGETYYQSVSEIIKSHTKAYREFERKYRYPVLQISAPMFIAQELLIPNYMSFKDFSPGTELRLNTGNEYVDFESESIDAALRFGNGDWPELDCRFVIDVQPKLTCSPAYKAKHGLGENGPISPEELSQHVLLSVFDGERDWKSLYPGIAPKNKIIYDSYLSVIRSAEEGLGIAVGLSPVVNRLVRENKLVFLESQEIETDFSYWLVAPYNRASSEHIDALYLWLKSLFDAIQ